MIARIILARAAQAAEALGYAAKPVWAEVAAGLRAPAREDGVIPAHDGYRVDEEKGSTPSPLMAVFPYWVELDPERAARTLRFYLDLWSGYVGSPMLPALYGVWAAWAGDRALSLKLLEAGYSLYQFPRFPQTLEYRRDKVPGGVPDRPADRLPGTEHHVRRLRDARAGCRPAGRLAGHGMQPHLGGGAADDASGPTWGAGRTDRLAIGGVAPSGPAPRSCESNRTMAAGRTVLAPPHRRFALMRPSRSITANTSSSTNSAARSKVRLA